VPNEPLTGRELVEIVVNDVRSIMQRNGMFSDYVAYGRVAYTVTVKFHFANPLCSEHQVKVRSRSQPGVPAIEGEPPLSNPGEQEAVLALQREREITSPNAERIIAGMPIKVTVRSGDRLETKKLQYDKNRVPPRAEPEDVDISEQVKDEWRKA
jgi:hypothetical protein